MTHDFIQDGARILPSNIFTAVLKTVELTDIPHIKENLLWVVGVESAETPGLS